MAGHWLGEKVLDQWVLRTTRANGGSVEELTERTRAALAEADIVRPFQFMPDDTDVWCSLQRLTNLGRVRKVQTARGIRYHGAHI